MPITLNKVIVVRSRRLPSATRKQLTRFCEQDGAPEVSYAEACTPPEGAVADSTPYCLGIDEAGRGAMLGHMTYGVAWCPVDKKEELATMGFTDSKMLTDKNRSKLLKILDDCEWLHYAVDLISPDLISGEMLRQERYNLNAISHDSAIGLIRMVIARGFNVTELFVDTVGIEEHYEKKLQQLFPSINCTVRKKADFIYPIVSAGSIGAKVTRDRRMEHWEHPPGELMWEGETGSGYPGDPITKKWLQENTQEFWGPPSCTRFSWRPVKDIVAEQCVEVDYGVPDEDDEEAMEARKATGGGIAQFFAGSAANRASKRVRGSYFSERNMSPCDDF